MKVKRFRDYPWWTWLLSLGAGIWLFDWLSNTDDQPFHELGHLLFGGGQIVSRTMTFMTMDWYGAHIAGVAFPIMVYAFAGRIARKWIPPLWCVGAMYQSLSVAFWYRGDFRGDFIHIGGIVAIFVLCMYTLLRPTHRSRFIVEWLPILCDQAGVTRRTQWPLRLPILPRTAPPRCGKTTALPQRRPLH